MYNFLLVNQSRHSVIHERGAQVPIVAMKTDVVVREADNRKERVLYYVKEADTGLTVHGSFHGDVPVLSTDKKDVEGTGDQPF